jgi:hypothetical protein
LHDESAEAMVVLQLRDEIRVRQVNELAREETRSLKISGIK